jgi:hypothetical protein
VKLDWAEPSAEWGRRVLYSTLHFSVDRFSPRMVLRRLLWCDFPIDQAAHTVDLTYCIEISNKFAASGKHSPKLDLEILTWVADANPIILREPL